jgi:glutamine amidotransferase
LSIQSEFHPDGWGVAYYLANSPHLIKNIDTALSDSLFKRVSGLVSSQTVVAHLRKSTVGSNSIINTHPFQHGRWVFVHNGNIKGFDKHRDAIRMLVHPELGKYVLGQTDSELMFYLILTFLAEETEIHASRHDFNTVKKALKKAINAIVSIAGPIHQEDAGPPEETYLTFLLTDGSLMFGYQAGKHLHYSTHKTKCPERKTCSFFAPACETKLDRGQINHLIFSSEPIAGENVWSPMKNGQLVGVDHDMNLFISNL